MVYLTGVYPLTASMVNINNINHLGKVAILIEWADSRQPSNEWVRLDGTDQRDYCRCYSIGFVVQDDDEVIVLAANVADIGEETQATGVIVIPAVAVLKRTTLTFSSPAVLKRKRQQI